MTHTHTRRYKIKCIKQNVDFKTMPKNVVTVIQNHIVLFLLELQIYQWLVPEKNVKHLKLMLQGKKYRWTTEYDEMMLI